MAKIELSELISKKTLEEKAVDVMTLRNTAPEFGKLITVFKGLRIVTQIVSIASGFCFFYYKLHSFISGFVGADVLSAFLAIALLVTIEGVVQYSIEKAAKMGFLNQYKWMGGLASIAVVFFAISFYISTQGIYLMASDTTVKNIDVETTFREQKKNIKAQYESRIADIKEDISKMATWRGKLSADQQKELGQKRATIENLYKEQKAELKAIDDQMQTELANIKKDAVSSASDYYVYVGVILAFELLTNFLVIFFYHHIMHDEQPKLSVEQEYKAYFEQAKQNARQTYLALASSEQRQCAMAMAEQMTQWGLRTGVVPVTIPLNSEPVQQPMQPEVVAPAASAPAPAAPAPTPEQQPQPSTKRRPGFRPDEGPDGPINDNGIPLSAPVEVPLTEFDGSQLPEMPSAPDANRLKIYRSVQPQQNASTESVHVPEGTELVSIRYCQKCGKKLSPSARKTAKYCSDKCRKMAYNERHPESPLRVKDDDLN